MLRRAGRQGQIIQVEPVFFELPLDVMAPRQVAPLQQLKTGQAHLPQGMVAAIQQRLDLAAQRPIAPQAGEAAEASIGLARLRLMDHIIAHDFLYCIYCIRISGLDFDTISVQYGFSFNN